MTYQAQCPYCSWAYNGERVTGCAKKLITHWKEEHKAIHATQENIQLIHLAVRQIKLKRRTR